MRFYAETPESATLAAILSTMGHVLHTIDRESEPAKAVRAVEGKIFCRCPTRWKPALERAGGDERKAARLLAQTGVDFVLDGPGVVDAPVFSSGDMAAVIGYCNA